MNLSQYHSALAAQRAGILSFEKKREYYLRLTNAIYGNVILNEKILIKNLAYELQEKLGPAFIVYDSSSYITVKYSMPFIGEYGFESCREIASINLRKNSINFRRKGASIGTKHIIFQRDLSIDKIARYVIRFGAK